MQLQQATKRRKKFFKRIASGLALASVIIIVIGVISYRSIFALVQTSKQAAYSHQVQEKLEHILAVKYIISTGIDRSERKQAERRKAGAAGDDEYISRI